MAGSGAASSNNAARVGVILLLVLPIVGGAVYAQPTSGSFILKVADQTDAALPGVDVELQIDGQPPRTGVTNPQGEFAFTNLPAGRAELVCKLINFAYGAPQRGRYARADGAHHRRDAPIAQRRRDRDRAKHLPQHRGSREPGRESRGSCIRGKPGRRYGQGSSTHDRSCGRARSSRPSRA
jgi:hypothetical protein